MRILKLGDSHKIENEVFENGEKVSTSKLLNPTFNLSEFNGSYDVILVDILESGMDDFGNRLVDTIYSGDIIAKKIVVISTAGVDNEINPTWIAANETEKKELLLESKYLNKLIDELELPYVILRPVQVVDSGNESEVKLSSEGSSIAGNTINKRGLLEVVKQAIFSSEFDNKSIGISN